MKCKLSLLEVIKFHKLMAARGHGREEDNKKRNILCSKYFITISRGFTVKGAYLTYYYYFLFAQKSKILLFSKLRNGILF